MLVLPACGPKSDSSPYGDYQITLTRVFAPSACYSNTYEAQDVVSYALNGDLVFTETTFHNVVLSDTGGVFVGNQIGEDFITFFGSIQPGTISGLLSFGLEGSLESSTAKCFDDYEVSGSK